MGMSYGAYVCIGVIVRNGEEELNQDFINKMSEEAEEQHDEFYFIDYLYNELDKKYDIVSGGTDDWDSYIVAIKSTVQEAEWDAKKINIRDLIVTQDSIDKIKKDLEKLGIEYGDSGAFLVPYFSH